MERGRECERAGERGHVLADIIRGGRKAVTSPLPFSVAPAGWRGPRVGSQVKALAYSVSTELRGSSKCDFIFFDYMWRNLCRHMLRL